MIPPCTTRVRSTLLAPRVGARGGRSGGAPGPRGFRSTAGGACRGRVDGSRRRVCEWQLHAFRRPAVNAGHALPTVLLADRREQGRPLMSAGARSSTRQSAAVSLSRDSVPTPTSRRDNGCPWGHVITTTVTDLVTTQTATCDGQGQLDRTGLLMLSAIPTRSVRGLGRPPAARSVSEMDNSRTCPRLRSPGLTRLSTPRRGGFSRRRSRAIGDPGTRAALRRSALIAAGFSRRDFGRNAIPGAFLAPMRTSRSLVPTRNHRRRSPAKASVRWW